MKKIIALLILIEALDFLTTAVGLRMGFVEFNPLVAKFGWAIMNFVKVAGTLFIAWALFWGQKYMPRFSKGLGIVLILIVSFPVVNNIILFYTG